MSQVQLTESELPKLGMCSWEGIKPKEPVCAFICCVKIPMTPIMEYDPKRAKKTSVFHFVFAINAILTLLSLLQTVRSEILGSIAVLCCEEREDREETSLSESACSFPVCVSTFDSESVFDLRMLRHLHAFPVL